MKARIDNEGVTIKDVHHLGYLPTITLDDGREYYIARTSEEAGEAAREYWEDLAQNDPQEFTCLIGEDVLVAWALGQSAGPGSTHVRSLQDWLDLHLDAPEETWAGYDGSELEWESNDKDLASELNRDSELQDEGKITGIAYRHN